MNGDLLAERRYRKVDVALLVVAVLFRSIDRSDFFQRVRLAVRSDPRQRSEADRLIGAETEGVEGVAACGDENDVVRLDDGDAGVGGEAALDVDQRPLVGVRGAAAARNTAAASTERLDAWRIMS